MKQILIAVPLFLIVFSAFGQEPVLTLKVETTLVNVPCTVTDRKGRLIANLTKDDFIIEEDGKRQEISKFAKENELPLTLAILMDTSRSVLPVLPEEKETAIAFINSILTQKDLAMVVKFDKYAKMVQSFTESKRRMEDAIDSVGRTGDGTALYDAVILAARDNLANESGRKAMILMTDGKDEGSVHRIKDAIFAAQQSDSVIYAISNVPDSRGPYGSGDPATLKTLSMETGGAAYFVRRTGEMTDIFDQIANELRTQYSLAYKSTNSRRDGKYRTIKVVAKDASLTVRTRKGYFGPTD